MNKLHSLSEELSWLKLGMVDYGNGTFAVGRKDIANPIIFFKTKNSGKNYTGTVGVKAINSSLYTKDQISGALRIINKYLQEGLEYSNKG